MKLVWDHDQERAARSAKELGAKVADLQEIWSDSDISAVVICSETNRHKELVRAGAKAKKHMFVEKPLGITGKESREMALLSATRNCCSRPATSCALTPKHLFLKEEIAKGNFGKIHARAARIVTAGSLGGWFDKEWRWMADPRSRAWAPLETWARTSWTF